MSGLGSVEVKALTPTTTSSPLSTRAPARGVRRDELALHVAGLDGGDRAAHLLHAVDLRPGAVDELGDLRLDDDRAGEEVVVLEQVALEGEHLLDAQRPLLVPRPRAGRAPRSTPGSCTARARASFDSVTREHLEHDALHVVLRLRLGEPEGVDLHAVAEAALLGVGDAVALAR